jgi:acyl-coenzyme A thioesterase PaaI-like protein
MYTPLNEKERQIAAGALFTAAETYKSCAALARKTEGHESLAKQFDRQAKEAAELGRRLV